MKIFFTQYYKRSMPERVGVKENNGEFRKTHNGDGGNKRTP